MRKLENEEIIKHLESIGEKNIKWHISTYYYYQLNDGLLIKFERKPSISKTLWYDDEQVMPKLTEELFINYNMINISGPYCKIEFDGGYIKPYLIKNYINDQKLASPCSNLYIADYESDLKWAKNKDIFIRFMEPEEIKEYNKICDELIQEYITRLKKYYKRYSKSK